MLGLNLLITFAGIPATIQLSGISLFTTAFAPITTLFPILTGFTILTPGLGKIRCAAKGARRPKSLLMAGSQFLCFADYIIYKGNNPQLAEDIAKLFYFDE